MSRLTVTDLTPAFGAEVSGFDPLELDDEELRNELRDLFDRRQLLVFHDQDLTHAEQVKLSKILLRDESADTSDDTLEDKFYISNRREDSAAPFGRLQFHSDTMWSAHGFEVLSLYGSHVEAPVAPTTFLSGTYAWETLPADLKARCEGLEVRHTAGPVHRGDLTDVLISTVEHPPTTVTPLARTHPRTGETILYACEQMTQEIVGLPHDESEALLGRLFEHLYAPEMRFDVEWHERDFVIWDNLATQHARGNVTTDGPARTLRKWGPCRSWPPTRSRPSCGEVNGFANPFTLDAGRPDHRGRPRHRRHHRPYSPRRGGGRAHRPHHRAGGGGGGPVRAAGGRPSPSPRTSTTPTRCRP
jgi:alpha-ketoglutarate-dependent taurine dioxygenase